MTDESLRADSPVLQNRGNTTTATPPTESNVDPSTGSNDRQSSSCLLESLYISSNRSRNTSPSPGSSTVRGSGRRTTDSGGGGDTGSVPGDGATLGSSELTGNEEGEQIEVEVAAEGEGEDLVTVEEDSGAVEGFGDSDEADEGHAEKSLKDGEADGNGSGDSEPESQPSQGLIHQARQGFSFDINTLMHATPFNPDFKWLEEDQQNRDRAHRRRLVHFVRDSTQLRLQRREILPWREVDPIVVPSNSGIPFSPSAQDWSSPTEAVAYYTSPQPIMFTNISDLPERPEHWTNSAINTRVLRSIFVNASCFADGPVNTEQTQPEEVEESSLSAPRSSSADSGETGGLSSSEPSPSSPGSPEEHIEALISASYFNRHAFLLQIKQCRDMGLTGNCCDIHTCQTIPVQLYPMGELWRANITAIILASSAAMIANAEDHMIPEPLIGQHRQNISFRNLCEEAQRVEKAIHVTAEELGIRSWSELSHFDEHGCLTFTVLTSRSGGNAADIWSLNTWAEVIKIHMVPDD